MNSRHKMKNECTIHFGIEYQQPVELTEFTKALNGFSNEYKKFINETYGNEQPVDAKLHIEKISEGSILTTLVEYSEFAIPFLGDINTVFEFGKHLKKAYGSFLGKKEYELDKKSLNNIKDIITPGTEVGANTEIEIKGNNNQILVLNANDIEASAISDRISKQIKKLDSKSSNCYTKELFYFDQAKKDIDSKVGNYGVIESLYPDKLRVVFDDDKVFKKKMLKGEFNPLKVSFIVDVEVQIKKGNPVTYKILHLHDIIKD
ncbi:hypothetical protein AB832_05580 [Flavobacteriaceae bacterium (ex Bugula neritina AB1)]|nr:hypothetical protein AB832_05580 [Flavobacteriaceae bacterium (ex Bugula neritina AB1)]